MIGTALTEEDAFQLLRGWSVVPEEKKPLARAKLEAYRDERVANGEPLWPNRQAARERAEVERQEKLWLTDQVTDSPESQLVRQIDFLSTFLQREPYLVSIEPNRYRQAVAAYLGNPAAGESQEAFDAMARRHVQKQRDRRLLIDGDGNPKNPDNGSSLTGFAADAARAGRTAVESWADWSRGASVKPGFAEAMADGEGLFTHFSRVHENARLQWQNFGQRADGILRELEARTNDWSPTLDTTAALPYLDGLTPPQRDAVLGLVVERAKAKDKGLGQQTGEAVGRVFARLVEAQVDVGERAATLSIFREGDPVPERLASDPAALVSLEMTRTARGFGVGPTSKLEYPEPPSGPTVKLTKEQADAANKAAAMRTESVSVAAKLRDIARGAVDPVKGSNWFTDSVYYPALNVAASIGSSAVPGGWLANLTAYVGDEQNRLEAAGVSPEVAGVQSLIVGGAQAAIDRLQLSLLKRLPSFSQLEGVSSRYWNTLPRVAAWTASPAASGVGALGRRSVGALATAGGEMLTEVVQQGFPLFTQKVFKWLGADEPDVAWSEMNKEAWAVAPDTFFGMLPLVMLGAGVGSVRDYKNVRSLVGDASALRQIGFADEQIERITKAGDAEAMVRALQAEWGGRTPIVGPAASPQEQANLDVLRDPTAPVGDVAAAAQTSARVETVRQVMQEMQAAAGVRSVRRTAAGWMLENEDGTVVVGTPEEVRSAMIGMGRARSEREAGAMMRLIDYFARQDAAEGVGSVTSVNAAAQVARQREDGTTEALSVRTKQDGTADVETLVWKPETLAQLTNEMRAAGVSEAAILGMNAALADDSGRLVRAYQTNAGADIRTILHERFERLYREGRVTQEQVWWAANRLTSLPQFDPARIRDEGQRRVAESLRRIATEDPTVTDAERQETMIDLVVADVLGRWQDGEKLPAGAIEAGIMEASMVGMSAEDQAAMTTFRAVWRAVKSYLKSMFGIAARIAQARRKGQIKDGDEWSGFVDSLLGVDVEKRHVEAVAREVQPDGGGFALGPITTIAANILADQRGVPGFLPSEFIGRKVIPIEADLTAGGGMFTRNPAQGGPAFSVLPEYFNAGVVWAASSDGFWTGKLNTARREGAVYIGADGKEKFLFGTYAMNQDSHVTNPTIAAEKLSEVSRYVSEGRITKENALGLSLLISEPAALNVKKLNDQAKPIEKKLNEARKQSDKAKSKHEVAKDKTKAFLVSNPSSSKIAFEKKLKSLKDAEGKLFEELKEAESEKKRIDSELNSLNSQIRSWQKLTEFKGQFTAKGFEDYLKSLTFEQRGFIADKLSSAAAEKLGAPPMLQVQRATLDESFAGVSPLSLISILEVDVERLESGILNKTLSADDFGVPRHNSYQSLAPGRVAAFFRTPIPYAQAFPSIRQGLLKKFPTNHGYFLKGRIPEGIPKAQEISEDILTAWNESQTSLRPNQAKAVVSALNQKWSVIDKPRQMGVADFVREIRNSDDAVTLAQYTTDQVNDLLKSGKMKVYRLADMNVWFALKENDAGEKEIVSVVNNEKGAPGLLPIIIAKAIAEGGRKLECYAVPSLKRPEGLLPSLYSPSGFVVTETIKRDAKSLEKNGMIQDLEKVWYSQGWNGQGMPDVVVMTWDENYHASLSRNADIVTKLESSSPEGGRGMAGGEIARAGTVSEGSAERLGGTGQGKTWGRLSDGAGASRDAGNTGNVLPRGIEQVVANLRALNDLQMEALGITRKERDSALAIYDAPAASSTSFSLGSVNTLEAIAARLEERAAAGGAEAKLEIYQNLSRTLEGMARAARGNEETEQIIAAGQIDAKRRELQQRLEDEYILEIYANPISEALTSEAATAIKENEFLRQFIDPSKKGLVGRFRSPKRARAAGRGMGEYEDAIRRGLPSWLFRGPDSPAGAPDVIASNLDIPMDVPEMWERIELELDSVARARASLEKAQDAVREAKARARTAAKDWALSERAKLAASDKRDESRTLITLDAILLQLPAEVRGRLGGFTKLSQLKTNDVRRKHFLEMVGKIDVELERYLRRSYVATIRELFMKSKPRRMAGEKDRGRLGVNAHAWIEKAEAASKMSEADLDGREKHIEAILAGADIGEAEIADLNRAWDFGEGADAARMALEQESAILDLFGGMTHFEKGVPVKGSGELEAALMALRATITTGRLVRESELMRRRADRETRRLQLQADSGNTGSDAEKQARKEAMQGFGGVAVKFARKGFSFEQFIGDLFGRGSNTHRFAEDTVMEAELSETARFNQAQSDLAAFLKSLWPRTGRLGRLRNLEGMATRKPVPGAPESAPKFSQLEAVHMTMLWADIDSRDWLTMHGYGEEMQAALEAYLTPESKAVRTWLAEWYDDQYDDLNEVYRRIHGTNMPRVQSYSPRMVEHGKDVAAIDPLGMGGLSARGVFAGFTKRRRPALTAAPVLADALQAWAQNQRVVTHFLAWAEASSELRAVFSTSSTASFIKAAGGEEAAVDLNQWLSDLEAGGVADAQGSALWKWWLRANTADKLFGKLGVLAKQIPAAYGSAAEVGWPEWLVSARRVLAGDAARTRSEAAQSRIMQGRAFTRPDEFLQAARGRGASPATGYVRRVTGVDLNAIDIALREIGGAIGRTDAFFTGFSAAVAYDAKFREAKESGDSDDAAHAYAERETERIIARTAQPETLANKSLGENHLGTWGRILFMFQSANRQALYMTAAAFRDGGMKSGEAWRKAVTHWAVTGLVTQTVGNIVRDLLTDDDDEEIWEAGDYLRAMMFGPLTGMLHAGPLIDAAASLLGGFERRQGVAPAAAITEVLKAFSKGDFDWRNTERIGKSMGLLLGGRFAALNVSANMAKQLVGAADNLYETQEEAAELEKKRAKKAKAKK